MHAAYLALVILVGVGSFVSLLQSMYQRGRKAGYDEGYEDGYALGHRTGVLGAELIARAKQR